MTNQRQRWIDSSTLSAGVILVLAMVAMVNYFAWKYYKRFDWTSEELYTLSEKSRSVVASLEAPIEAVVFLSPGDPLFAPVDELLQRYAAESTNFSTRVVDPEKNLAEAQSLVDKYGLSQLEVIVFDRGDDRRVVESIDLADYDYSGLQAGLGPKMTAFKGEQVFTGVMLDLAEDRKPRVLFSTGHGELSLDDRSPRGLSDLETLLGRDNFELEEWSLLESPVIPTDVDAFVIAGPTAGFVEPEVRSLEAYLAAGGRLVAMLDPILGASGGAGASGLEGLLSSYGVEVGGDIVIDPEGPIPFFGAETFFASSFGDHPITEPLRQSQIPVIVPLAQSIEADTEADGRDVGVLIETSPAGWGERDLANLDRVALDDGDLAGPVAIAVAIEVGADEETDAELDTVEGSQGEPSDDTLEGAKASPEAAERNARLVVVGDADFATNSQLRNVGNAEVAANIINWLVERENLITIPAKEPEQVRLTLTAGEVRSIGLLVFLVLPGLALGAGAAVFSRRRR